MSCLVQSFSAAPSRSSPLVWLKRTNSSALSYSGFPPSSDPKRASARAFGSKFIPGEGKREGREEDAVPIGGGGCFKWRRGRGSRRGRKTRNRDRGMWVERMRGGEREARQLKFAVWDDGSGREGVDGHLLFLFGAAPSPLTASSSLKNILERSRISYQSILLPPFHPPCRLPPPQLHKSLSMWRGRPPRRTSPSSPPAPPSSTLPPLLEPSLTPGSLRTESLKVSLICITSHISAKRVYPFRRQMRRERVELNFRPLNR